MVVGGGKSSQSANPYGAGDGDLDVGIPLRARIFPHMNNSSNPSAYMSKALQRVAPSIDGMDKDSTAVCIRRGGIDDILMHRHGSFEVAVATSGHDHTNISSMFEYATCHLYWSYNGALIISGWDAYDGGVTLGQVASFDMILDECDDNKKDVLESLIVSVLDIADDSSQFAKGNRLWPLAKSLFATLLKDFEAMQESYPNHVVMKTIYQKARTFDVSLGELRRIGKIIRDHWNSLNVDAQAKARLHNDNENCAKLQAVIQKQGEHIKELSLAVYAQKLQAEETANSVQQLTQCNTEMRKMLETLVGS